MPNPKVDAFINKAEKWQAEFKILRKNILELPLVEELKWGKPCYSFQGSNMVILQGFKEYCAVMFCTGALLKDASGILVKLTENVQAARQVRFTNVREIAQVESLLKSYLQEAIEAKKAGLQVKYKETSDFIFPDELQKKFAESPSFKAAFDALTPGRQRGYILHFSAAKQAKTRESRIEKWTPQILRGKGLDD